MFWIALAHVWMRINHFLLGQNSPLIDYQLALKNKKRRGGYLDWSQIYKYYMTGGRGII